MRMSEATETLDISRRTSSELVGAAVHRNRLLSRAGLSERAFTFAFSSLVYPQIWEDPVVDLEAMEIKSHHRIITIASGGCNVMSYLTGKSGAHHGGRPQYGAHRAEQAENRRRAPPPGLRRVLQAFRRRQHSRKHQQPSTPGSIRTSMRKRRRYWNGRDMRGRRRIERFSRGFYRHGLLGQFIAAGHVAARLFGKDPRRMMTAKSREEQIKIYEADLAPLFDKPLIKRLLNQRSSLFGLGIPPAQYDALAGGRPMHVVVEERLRRLACGFDLKDNYFAVQAFHRGYAPDGKGPLPPYLQAGNFDAVRSHAERVNVVHASFTTHLTQQRASHLRPLRAARRTGLDGGSAISPNFGARSRARPGPARASSSAPPARRRSCPGAFPRRILGQWRYEAEQSQAWTRARPLGDLRRLPSLREGGVT